MSEQQRTQQYRPLAVGTPLGDDVLLLRSFSGGERLGRLFEYRLEMVSENANIAFQDIVGQNVTVRAQKSPDEQPRYFNGYFSSFTQVQTGSDLAAYRATMVPWLWFLTRTSDCRIYQGKSVPQIIQEILEEFGYTDLDNRLHGEHRTWDYCVLYRETYFNFLSRLMEQEGIYYYFLHDNGRHSLVLADDATAHDPFSGYEEIQYRPPTTSLREREYVTEWAVRQQVQPGTYTHTDYNFTTPRSSLLASSNISRPDAVPDFEFFEYPGEFTETSEGQSYARLRIEELQARYETATGSSDVRGIATGHKFTLTEHPREDQNREYLVVATDISASVGGYGTGGADSSNYSCSFAVLAASEPYRSPRITPKPIVEGPQTAVVTGPSGEEIHTDEHGRVKVQFHWDRYSEANENSSCWIRVSQPWAGKKWGGIFLPRIGQEVIVEFLEGDPDRPIITGRVYNGVAKPPYDLPANATMSTVKSNSSKGGGGFNEIRLEDKKSKEQIFIHAQRNMDERVLANSREWIGNDRHLIVKKKQYELVEEDKHLHIKMNHKEKIDQDMHLHVVGNENIQVDQNISRQSGMNTDEKTGMKWAHEAGQEVHLKGGMKVIIEAGMQLTIKGAGGFVDIGPAGVTIQGTMVNINSGGAAGVGSGSSPTSPTDPEDAKPADDDNAGSVDEAPPAPTPPTPVTYSSQARVMQRAAEEATPFCEKCAAAAAARRQEAAQQAQQEAAQQAQQEAAQQQAASSQSTGGEPPASKQSDGGQQADIGQSEAQQQAGGGSAGGEEK